MSRWHMPDATLFHSNPDLGIQVWSWTLGGDLVAIGYGGRRTKHDFYNRFKTEAQLRDYVSLWEASQRAWKDKVSVSRKAVPHDVNVGDVFRCQWGYDQTNTDYFQVVALVGTTMATVRAICSDRDVDGFEQGSCVPLVGQWKGDPYNVRLRGGENPSFRVYSFANAYRLKPTAEVSGEKLFSPDRWSAYA